MDTADGSRISKAKAIRMPGRLIGDRSKAANQKQPCPFVLVFQIIVQIFQRVPDFSFFFLINQITFQFGTSVKVKQWSAYAASTTLWSVTCRIFTHFGHSGRITTSPPALTSRS